MSRRDTIILSVIINTVLLALLFFSAVQTDKKSSGTMQEVVATQAKGDKTLKQSSPETSSSAVLDPLDQAIEQYTAKLNEESKKAQHRQLIKPLPKVLEEKKPSPIGERVITVMKGDVLEKLAKQHRVSVEQLMRENGLTTTALRIGQKIKIPESREEQAKQALPTKPIAEPKYYVVKGGDNVWTIAMKHKLQVEQLLKLNHLDEEKARKIRPGDKLRIE